MQSAQNSVQLLNHRTAEKRQCSTLQPMRSAASGFKIAATPSKQAVWPILDFSCNILKIASSYTSENGDIMKKITFIRLFILVLVTACSLSLLVVEKTSSSGSAVGSEPNQRSFRYVQGEFIIWETMGQVILSSSTR